MSRVKLVSFDDVALPIYNPRLAGGTAPSREATITLADGTVYDAIGADWAEIALPYTLTYECMALEDDASTLQTTLVSLMGKRGQRGKLYRRVLNDDTIHWAWARPLQIPSATGMGGLITHTPLTFQFQILSAWRGYYRIDWLLDDSYYLDDGLFLNDNSYTETMASSPHIITVTNGGNGVCRDAIITITAGAANITALTIATGYTDIDWTGTLVAGNALVLDCGAKSILNNGVNAYSGFSYGAVHTLSGWLELPPGDTAITITFTGGSTNSTVNVTFRDSWE